MTRQGRAHEMTLALALGCTGWAGCALSAPNQFLDSVHCFSHCLDTIHQFFFENIYIYIYIYIYNNNNNNNNKTKQNKIK